MIRETDWASTGRRRRRHINCSSSLTQPTFHPTRNEIVRNLIYPVYTTSTDIPTLVAQGKGQMRSRLNRPSQ